MPCGILHLAPDGTLLMANTRAQEILGRPLSQIRQRHYREVMPQTIREDGNVCDPSDSPIFQCLTTHQPQSNSTVGLRRPDGLTAWALLASVPLSDPDTGESLGALATLQDITSQKQAERELADQSSFLREVIDLNPNIIFAKDRAGKFTLVNQALADFYGTTVEDLLKKQPADLASRFGEMVGFHGDDREVIDTGVEKFIGNERITDAQGRPRWVQIIKRPLLFPDGTAVQLLGVATDITEHKNIEAQMRQLQKMEAIGRLASGVAHDFNNLLTAITGYLELMSSRLSPGDPLHHEISQIQKAGERAGELTRQLLSFSRRQAVVSQAVDLNRMLSQLKEMLQRIIGEDILLSLMLSPKPGPVLADPSQIEQVILNLALNARDAMPHGGQLTIETKSVMLDQAHSLRYPHLKPGCFVQVEVTDSGCGMDRDVQEKIFEPFFTTKAPGRGTGLGLSTAYGIIRQSGGDISVETQPRRGSTFRIYLPELERKPPTVQPSKRKGEAPGGTETVLLVEDEEAVRGLIREVLGRVGYQVLEAQHGKEALQIGRNYREPIHLLITDVVMPQMNGHEVARHLSSLHPETKVLYMSGYADNVLASHGLETQHLAFLQKPFTPSILKGKIREILEAADQETA